MSLPVITPPIEIIQPAPMPSPYYGGRIELGTPVGTIVPREMGSPETPARLLIGPIVPMTPEPRK